MNKSFLTLLCIAYVILGQAQITPFQQFQAAPLVLNPALTGIETQARIDAIAQKSWGSIYNDHYYGINALSFDKPFVLKNGDRIGGGILASFEQAGTSKFGHRGGYLMGSYQKKMAESTNQIHYLSAGVKVGHLEQRILLDSLMFGSQHDGNGGFDPNLPGENMLEKISFQDIGIGFVWRTTVKNTASHYEVGLFGGHLNRPNNSMQNADERLRRVFQFHALADIYVGEQVRIIPRFRYYAQSFSTLRSVTTNFRILFAPDSPNSIEFGGGLQQALGGIGVASNVIFNLGLNIQNVHLHTGISIFEERVVEQVGLATLSLGYRFGGKTTRYED